MSNLNLFPYDNARNNLESAIIGAVFCSQKIHEIIHVVTHKNFKNPSYSKIYKVIESMYGVAPIDLVTVAFKIREAYPNASTELNFLASSAVNYVGSTANVYYHAFILLQEDITEKLYDLLNKIRQEFPLSAEDTKSIMLHIAGKTIDVFEVLELALEFYQKKEMEAEYEMLKEFENNILKKIKQIKQMAQVQLAMEMLSQIADTPPHYKRLTSLLRDGIVSVFMTNKLPANFISNVTALTEELYAI